MRKASVFFFQAEDGIRDKLVTGVQTCALPILRDCQARRGWSNSDAQCSGVSARGVARRSHERARGLRPAAGPQSWRRARRTGTKTAAAAEVARLRKRCYNAIPVAADELPSAR